MSRRMIYVILGVVAVVIVLTLTSVAFNSGNTEIETGENPVTQTTP